MIEAGCGVGSATMTMVYTLLMRRIQLYVDDEVDEALSAEAARLGTSPVGFGSRRSSRPR